MRVLALDVGGKRIGLAVSDPQGRIALPLGALERRDLEADMAALTEIVQQQGAEKVVAGLPVSMDGSLGPQAQEVLAFAEALARRLEVPLEMWDERLTTVEAERRLRELGHLHGQGRRPERVGDERQGRRGGLRDRRLRRGLARARQDALAATIILEDYLSSQRSGVNSP